MGTRHLIAVQVDGEYKVAQYGQWDGYPSETGANVLEFLRNVNLGDFKNAVRGCSELSDEEYTKLWESCGIDISSGTVAYEDAKAFSARFPHLHRDCGDKVLKIILDSQTGIPLRYNLEFAGSSLYCEWAYVIDLDKNTFEVFEGFNKSPLDPNERFASLEASNGYYQVKLVQSYPLDNLPEEDSFLADLDD